MYAEFRACKPKVPPTKFSVHGTSLVFLSLYYPLNSQISTSQLRHLLSSNIYTVPMLPMYTMDLEKLDLQAKDSYYDIYH